MSYNNNNNAGNMNNGNNAGLSLSDTGRLDLELTEKEVEDALNDFDLDFDGLEGMGDALPNINLDEMGSLGTRSPSPSNCSSSVFSKGSKRSRAEFDSESECDSRRNDKERRMAFPSHEIAGGPQQQQLQYAAGRSDGSGISHGQQEDVMHNNNQQTRDQNQKGTSGSKSPTKVIRRDREREGRCPHCGLDTHRIVMNEKGFELQPLTIEGEVLNGQCLLCGPRNQPEGGGGQLGQLAIVPVQQGAIVPISVPDNKPSGIQTQKKGGRSKKSNGDFKKKGSSGRQKGDAIDNMEPQGKQSSALPPSRGMSVGSGVGGGNFNMGSNMGSPPAHAQQRKMMRTNSSPSTQQGGNNAPSFPPPLREVRTLRLGPR